MFGIEAPQQVLHIVIVCIEPRQQQNKVGVAETNVLLPNVRNIVKVAAGGVVVDFVVMHCRVPCPKLSVPCLIVTRFPFRRAPLRRSYPWAGVMAWWVCSGAARV